MVLQINDLLVYSRLHTLDEQSSSSGAWTEFRLAVKRRFFIRCLHMFPGAAKKLKAQANQKSLSEAYIWNEVLEEDQFARLIG